MAKHKCDKCSEEDPCEECAMLDEMQRLSGIVLEGQAEMAMADRLENDAAFLEDLYKQLRNERFLDMSTRIRSAAGLVRKCEA
jgi:hypothetical protein